VLFRSLFQPAPTLQHLQPTSTLAQTKAPLSLAPPPVHTQPPTTQAHPILHTQPATTPATTTLQTLAAVTTTPPPQIQPPAPKLSFYMYRAQNDHDYPFENVNAADLAGVMSYLHNEVVGMTPRKFNITRVLRLKVTMQNTQKMVDALRNPFSPFVAFDSGKCTVMNCDSVWNKFGFVVGCQNFNRDVANYVRESPEPTTVSMRRLHTGSDRGLQGGVWYSLPGPCPDQVNAHKSEECRARMPGGRCQSQFVDGSRDCTYTSEYAGEVRLDELSGILNEDKGFRTYEDFWKKSFDTCLQELRQGNRSAPCHRNEEYNRITDKGVGCSFWDHIHDAGLCNKRMTKLLRLFEDKFPMFPARLDEPQC